MCREKKKFGISKTTHMSLHHQVFDKRRSIDHQIEDASVLSYLIVVDVLVIYIVLLFYFLRVRNRKTQPQEKIEKKDPVYRTVVRITGHLLSSILLFLCIWYSLFRVSEAVTRKTIMEKYQGKLDERLIEPLRGVGFSHESIMELIRELGLGTPFVMLKKVMKQTRGLDVLDISKLMVFCQTVFQPSFNALSVFFIKNKNVILQLGIKTGRVKVMTTLLQYSPTWMKAPLTMGTLVINPTMNIQSATLEIFQKDMIHNLNIFISYYMNGVLQHYYNLFMSSVATAGVSVVYLKKKEIHAMLTLLGWKDSDRPRLPSRSTNTGRSLRQS